MVEYFNCKICNKNFLIDEKYQYSEGSISSYFNSTNPFKKFYNLYLKKFNIKFFQNTNLTIHQVQSRVNTLNKEQETDHTTIILKKKIM